MTDNLEQAANIVLHIFGLMNSEQRAAMVKLLKTLKPKLDMNYPNGIPQEKEKPANSGLIVPLSAGAQKV